MVRDRDQVIYIVSHRDMVGSALVRRLTALGYFEAIELPGGRIEIRAARASRSIDDFIGLLAEKTGKVASLSELQEAAANSWAGRS